MADKRRFNNLTWVRKMHEEYKSKLEKAGLIVSSLIKEGDPKVVLVNEARRWGADCIFLGAAGAQQGSGISLEAFRPLSRPAPIVPLRSSGIRKERQRKNKLF